MSRSRKAPASVSRSSRASSSRRSFLGEPSPVRRLAYGVGVEKVFPIHSPLIEKVETVRSGYVRRAKLYYLRGRVGKAAKIREKL